MSSVSTPTRSGRGLVVPGIDTKRLMEYTSTAPSYGGLYTPPQSAHESRRPSLQYSALSEAPCSTTSSSFAHSQPTTPIHTINHGNDGLIHGWPEGSGSHNGVPTSNLASCGTNHLSEPNLDAAFVPRPAYNDTGMDTMPSYSHTAQHCEADAFGLHVTPELPTMEAWRPSQPMVNGYNAQTACFGPALFPTPQPMNSINSVPASAYDPTESSFHGMTPSYNASPFGSMLVQRSDSLYQNPLVVVPSQLSPEVNYPQHEASEYGSVENNSDLLASSFGSSTSGYLGYEMVQPPSPVDAYFAHSEDEDYLTVKAEEMSSPSVGPCMHSGSRNLRLRSRKRSSKRLRSSGRHTAWYSHEVGSTIVQCVGTEFRIDNDRPIKLEPAVSKKQYACQFVSPEGHRCVSRFDRMEHLKRHMGKHSVERPYPCPLACCDKRIQRPDNAGDHFKTHLRPKKKGKRNDHVEWEVLRDAIWDQYEDKKKAKKLLDGLARWLEAGMPETSGQRRGN